MQQRLGRSSELACHTRDEKTQTVLVRKAFGIKRAFSPSLLALGEVENAEDVAALKLDRIPLRSQRLLIDERQRGLEYCMFSSC